MGKYIHKFNTVSDFNEHRSENYIQPWVSYTSENDKMDYNEYSAEDYEMLNTPLTFEALEDQTCITFYQSTCAVNDEMPVLEIEISTDNGNTWTTKQAELYSTQFAAPTLMLNAGEKVLIRGNNSAYGYYSNSEDAEISNCGFFAESACYVYGNIMSLIDKNNFSTLREVTDNAFSYLFSDYDGSLDGSWLLSHPEKKLLLPAVTVGTYCYCYMFSNCTNLTITPEISAITLSDYCCYCMFYGCTHLIKANKLPATTLANYCYGQMFYNCTNLTTASELPATTLATGCYANMFRGCTSLITAPELPATTLAESCYSQMFYTCTSLITAPELPATTLVDSCYMYMFQGCTNLTTASELPATTLANYCYAYMFQNCTYLTTAPELPATTLVNNCYNSMFRACSRLNYIKAMFITIPSGATSNWVSLVASTGTFIKNINAEWDVTGKDGIPAGWTVGYYPELQ